MSVRTTEIKISLELLLPHGEELQDHICGSAARRVAELADTLGIPAAPMVELAGGDAPADGAPFLRVLVGGRHCRYQGQVLVRVYEWLRGLFSGSGATLHDVREWLQGALAGDDAARSLAAEYVGWACMEIARSHPSVLIGPDQVRILLEDFQAQTPTGKLDASNWPPGADWIGPVLRELVDLRLSLRDRARIGEVLMTGRAAGRSRDDIVEDLIGALSPDIIEIRMPREYLQVISSTDGGQTGELARVRDTLFRELGMHYPDLRFVIADELSAHQFSFRINHLETLPWVGLPADRCLVNASPERLAQVGIQAEPLVNPNTLERWSAIDAADQQRAQSSSLPVWDAAQDLVLFLAAELRGLSACLVNRTRVQAELTRVKTTSPTLLNAALGRFPVERITRVLRLLVAEQISILDLRRILESLLDYDYVVIDPTKYAVLDPRLPTLETPNQSWLDEPDNVAAFVRCRLRRYIAMKYGDPERAMPVWLLDSSVEHILIHERESPPEDLERVATAIRMEVAKWKNAWLPGIVTSIPARFALHRLLALEFPRIQAFAYQEIVGVVKAESVGRIQFPEAAVAP